MKAVYYCQENQLLDALEILRKMVDAKMVLPDATWRLLARKLLKDNFKEDAIKVIEIARQSGADATQFQKYIDKFS